MQLKIYQENAIDELLGKTKRLLELVCIPSDLNKFSEIVNKWKKVKGEPIGKYTQRILPEGIKLDLFMANEKNYRNQETYTF
ncbi:MAG: hypothetical protein BWY51_00931 [Parcubacteria group bacterium ADurb.Bin316]|nr:MAG: hypothetical protein BWY51_00931 [Parcubacteria group bacterium ADurb.Bin316]